VLAAVGNQDAVARLIADLRGPGGNKVALIEALADSGAAQAVPPLQQILDDPRPEHRAAAARALGRLRAGQAIPKLRTMLQDPRAEVRIGAATGLAALEDYAGQDQLQTWLRSEVEDQRVMAAEALASRPDSNWHGVVRQLTNSRDPNILLAAARLVAPYDPTLARAVVERLLQDSNGVVRESAGRVLARQVAGDFRTLRALFRATDPVVRVGGAARVLELTR
jgi:HEAT repeat protein